MRVSLNLALLTTLALGACGKSLGTYEVRDVKLVAGAALDKIEPSREPGPDLLRIEFTSATDMYEASDGGGSGLYVWASFCPYDEDRRLRTFGPYYNDRYPYGTPYTTRDVDAAGNVVETVHVEERRPIRNAHTGEYTYTAYLAPAAPTDQAWQTPYDLRKQLSDICLRIDHPGYFITPSRSRVFKIPAAMIRAALLNDQAARLQRRP